MTQPRGGMRSPLLACIPRGALHAALHPFKHQEPFLSLFWGEGCYGLSWQPTCHMPHRNFAGGVTAGHSGTIRAAPLGARPAAQPQAPRASRENRGSTGSKEQGDNRAHLCPAQPHQGRPRVLHRPGDAHTAAGSSRGRAAGSQRAAPFPASAASRLRSHLTPLREHVSSSRLVGAVGTGARHSSVISCVSPGHRDTGIRGHRQGHLGLTRPTSPREGIVQGMGRSGCFFARVGGVAGQDPRGCSQTAVSTGGKHPCPGY